VLFRDVTTIDAPPERVFAFFAAMAANYRRWHPDHLGYRWLSGNGLHEGATASFEERIGGKLLTKRVCFAHVEPGRYVAMAPTNRLMRLVLPRLSFRMEPEGPGCRLTAEIVVRTGPVGAWLNRREFDAVRRHMREEGENLKRLLEARPAGAGHPEEALG
jgi:uncharacterized protein YndB with AHSA1/START domain